MSDRLVVKDAELFKMLLDSALSVALIACDKSGKVTRFSRGAELMLGYCADEIVGRATLELFHDPVELAARAEALSQELGKPVSVAETFGARLDTQRSDEADWTYVRKDGARITVRLSISALTSPDGERLGLLGTAVDITKRKEMEDALLREKRFFEQVMNGLPGVFYLYDKELRLRRWNRNHETLLGYSKTELDGFFVGDWHPTSEARAMAIAATRGILEQGVELDAIESALLHKDGTYTPFLLTGVRIETPDGPMMAGFGIDLTERRKLEEQLRQSQKMESVGRLAGGVAHDFNNLLTTIIGNVELCSDVVDASSPVREYLANVTRAAQSAATLTRQLLAFSRKQLVAPRVLDITQVLRGMRGMLTRLLGEDVAVSLSLREDVWPVFIDPGQLDQIILNLVVNARDAMPDGGRLTLEVENTTLDDAALAGHPGAKPGPYVKLTVSDSGCGMGQEVLTHIFEPFFTTKEKGRGSGLGLSIVLGSLQQNQGFIEVHSEPNVGTSFEVFLPKASEVAAHSARPPAQGRPQGGVETILLAEDDSGIRAVATEVLTRLGYRVLACPDASTALDAALGAGRVDLLLTDLIMPDMNGRELAERLRSRLKQLRVLYTSGYTADIIGRHGMLEPTVEFLPKPYTPEELARRVRSCLDDQSSGLPTT